jgi:predicted DNA-binding transcriptional regulator AlpA
MPDSILTLNLADVAHLLGYSRAQVLRLVRQGHLPQPIDDQLHARSWRWSRAAIDRYLQDSEVA